MQPIAHRSDRGFSLIEILVGVAIGLIGMLIMFRMVTLWDAHTRTSTSGSDAQVAGTLALFNLERDIKQAGMGLGTADASVMGCNVQANDTVGPRTFNFFFDPVSIVVGPGGAPDQINVLYGNSSFYVAEQPYTSGTAATKTALRRGGFRRGDLVVVADGGSGPPSATNCTLVEVTDDTNLDNLTLAHTVGSYDSFYLTAASGVARFNTAAGTPAAFAAGGRLYNLGPSPQMNMWQVGAGNLLTHTDLIHNTAAFDVAGGVVNLKAEYGVDSNGDGRITDSSPNEWTTTLPVNVNWRTVLAVRAAILVRSKQFERTADPSASAPVAVTATPPSWGASGVHAFVMTNVDGTPDSYSANQSHPNNWRYYRYRVYERVIPLRNTIWGTAP